MSRARLAISSTQSMKWVGMPPKMAILSDSIKSSAASALHCGMVTSVAAQQDRRQQLRAGTCHVIERHVAKDGIARLYMQRSGDVLHVPEHDVGCASRPWGNPWSPRCRQ